ncbi:ATP-binding protein [Streptomyces sp. NPDC058257]|uniref:ATP-binding protein n=1 Tax=Streptomyces sp. NPDC058257 TaxID=3346409 RepID=UPI0036F0E251
MPELALKRQPVSHADEDWEYALRIPHTPLGPGIVRAHVRAVLSRYRVRPAVLDNVQLVASELVTNSLAWTCDSVAVRLARTHSRLRLGVWDSSPQLPPTPLGVSDADSEGGRGLWLLRRCADDWGHYVLINGLRATGGKEVWAEWHAPYSNE